MILFRICHLSCAPFSKSSSFYIPKLYLLVIISIKECLSVSLHTACQFQIYHNYKQMIDFLLLDFKCMNTADSYVLVFAWEITWFLKCLFVVAWNLLMFLSKLHDLDRWSLPHSFTNYVRFVRLFPYAARVIFPISCSWSDRKSPGVKGKSFSVLKICSLHIFTVCNFFCL